MKVKQEKYQSSILAFDNTLSPEILFYVWILLKSRRVDTSIQITQDVGSFSSIQDSEIRKLPDLLPAK